jgi:hypothetical protein
MQKEDEDTEKDEDKDKGKSARVCIARQLFTK